MFESCWAGAHILERRSRQWTKQMKAIRAMTLRKKKKAPILTGKKNGPEDSLSAWKEATEGKGKEMAVKRRRRAAMDVKRSVGTERCQDLHSGHPYEPSRTLSLRWTSIWNRCLSTKCSAAKQFAKKRLEENTGEDSDWWHSERRREKAQDDAFSIHL